VQWKDNYRRLIDFSNISSPVSYVLLSDVRRVKKEKGTAVFIVSISVYIMTPKLGG